MYVVLLNQVACVQMINALVTTPEDLDFRLHLRNEFVREGLYEAIQVRPNLGHNFKHTLVYFTLNLTCVHCTLGLQN